LTENSVCAMTTCKYTKFPIHDTMHFFPSILQTPTRASDKRNSCCLCCNRGPVSLQAELERSAYCCGENI